MMELEMDGETLRCALGALAIGVAHYSVLERVGLDDWLARGHHDTLDYMAQHRREDPRVVYPDCRSVIVVLFGPQRWNYHSYIRRRLRRFLGILAQAHPGLEGRGVVDTAPVMERRWAEMAGLGRCGRNSMLIHTQFGSDFNIGILLVNRPATELGWVQSGVGATRQDPCIGCEKCVDACPGKAIDPLARSVDCRKCHSHLSQKATQNRPAKKGCTICQNACPHNNQTPAMAD